ncbi:C40 family peptidase [Nocardia sp. NPDC046473]|uniref:C40 family peptidase n=1 Tax=Nocardia sp. NPDC046473 TaxID=3155733 RepID=UPI0033C669E0
MASIDEGSEQGKWYRALTISVVATAATSSLLLAQTPAHARPIGLPDIGNLELPNEVTIPDIQEPLNSVAERAFDAARSKLGAPYGSGAAGPDAFDCSGLVQWAYRRAGREVPRTSGAQLAAGTPVSQRELRVGDLVSFYGGGHSGLYAGNGTVIHAGTESTGVELAPISSMPYAGARRL